MSLIVFEGNLGLILLCLFCVFCDFIGCKRCWLIDKCGMIVYFIFVSFYRGINYKMFLLEIEEDKILEMKNKCI